MNRFVFRARTTILDIFSRVLNGRAVAAEEHDALREEMRLSGFRRTARGYLLGQIARRGRADGLRLLVPALDGLFTIAVAGDDLVVGGEILDRGIYEPHIVAFYRRTLRAGMSVADVGANIGFHALHAAVLVGREGRVLAVEPDPKNAALLRLSLSLGGGALRVDVIEVALSDVSGEIVLSDLGNARNSGARFTHHDREVLKRLVHGPAPEFRAVRALRWDDDYLETKIDLVKIDVEGFEPHAMRGMEGSLARWRPIVISEFAPSNLASIGGIDPFAYTTWFRERDYSCAIIREDGSGSPSSDEQIRAHLRGEHHVDLAFLPR